MNRNIYQKNFSTWSFGIMVSILLFGFLGGVGAIGCRGVPFYRMTSKTSESLTYSREGMLAFERENYALAEENFQKARELNETDIEIQRYYAETLWKQGQSEQAIDILVAASSKIGSLDNEIALLQSLGEKFLATDQPSQALVYSEKLITLAPKKPEGWAIRANAYWQLGETDKALDDYQKALHFSPDHRDLLWQIANLQTEDGKYEQALATWQHLGRIYPANMIPTEIILGEAKAFYGQNRLDDALERFEVALEQSNSKVDIYLSMVDIYLQKKDWIHAEEFAHMAHAISPDNPATMERLRYLEDVQLAILPSANEKY